MERGVDRTELSIKVGKPHKTLHSCVVLRCRPALHNLDLRIDLDPSFRDDVTQKGHCSRVELISYSHRDRAATDAEGPDRHTLGGTGDWEKK